MKAMDEVLNKLIDTDPNLKGAVEAERSKIQKGFTNLENKLRKSVKRQQEVDIQRLKKIKDELFPSGVFQERRVNAIQILLTFDINLIELLLDHFDPLDNQLKVFIG